MRGQNKTGVTHQIFLIIQRQAMFLFKICVPLMVRALKGGGGEWQGGGKIKPQKAKKLLKKRFFDALGKA
jgi:hypothetical protein